MDGDQVEILKGIASELDAHLSRKNANVVSVGVEANSLDSSTFGIIVLVNDINVCSEIPGSYKGHKIYVKMVGQPKFAFG